MSKVDKAALFTGIAGAWVYMANVEQGRWTYVLAGAALLLLSLALKKAGDCIERRQEEQETLEQLHREKTFAAWISGGTLKG